MNKELIKEVQCSECGNAIKIFAAIDHSEYAPCGTCEKCGLIHFIVYLNGNGELKTFRPVNQEANK